MKTLICIALVWLAGAFVTAWLWHRLRRHEKWMEEQLRQKIEEDKRFYTYHMEKGMIRGDDTDSTTFMGMDKATELTKAQLDRLQCPDCAGKGFTYSDPDGKQLVCHTCEGEEEHK